MTLRRQVLALVATLTLLGTAAACGGRSESDEADTTTTTAEGGEKTLAKAPGFDGETITLGVLTASSGRVAIIGNAITAGNKAYFDHVNAEGGIAGEYPVELLIEDSAYDAPTAGQKYEQMKSKVTMFAQLLGTPIVKPILEKLKTDNVVAGPASFDSFWVREQQLLAVGAPYQIQAINALHYYRTDGGGEGKTVCALYQNDPYGEAGLAGLKHAAKAEKSELGAEVSFTLGNPDFTTQINQLRSAKCDMVFLVATPSDTGSALGKAAELKFAPKWMGQSPTWVTGLAKSPLAPYLTANFLLVSEGAEYGDTTVPGMKLLSEIMETYAKDVAPDPYFTFGVIEAMAAEQLLEAAVEAGDLSREGIVAAMNGIDELTFQGLSGDYAYGKPADRVPPTVNSIFAVDAAKPYGLKLVAADVEAPAAKTFEFAG